MGSWGSKKNVEQPKKVVKKDTKVKEEAPPAPSVPKLDTLPSK